MQTAPHRAMVARLSVAAEGGQRHLQTPCRQSTEPDRVPLLPETVQLGFMGTPSRKAKGTRLLGWVGLPSVPEKSQDTPEVLQRAQDSPGLTEIPLPHAVPHRTSACPRLLTSRVRKVQALCFLAQLFQRHSALTSRGRVTAGDSCCSAGRQSVR